MKLFIFTLAFCFTACSSGKNLIKDNVFDEGFASEGIIDGRYILVLKTFRQMEIGEVDGFSGRFEEIEKYRKYEKYNLEHLSGEYFFKRSQEDLREIIKTSFSKDENVSFKKVMNNLGYVDLKQQVNCINTNISKSFKEFVYVRECRIRMEIPSKNLLEIYSLNAPQIVVEKIRNQISLITNFVHPLRESDQRIIPPYRLNR